MSLTSPPHQSSPAQRPYRRVGRGTVLVALLVASVIGFLGGGLLGAVGIGFPTPQVATSSEASSTPSPADQESTPAIGLRAGATSAGPGQRVPLTGSTSPATANVVLQVQRAETGGPFQQFPVTVTTIEDGTFYTEVATQQTGENLFRVVGEIDGTRVSSNAVTIQIG